MRLTSAAGVRVGHRHLADLEPVAHDGDAVGDAEDLVEPVRHVDHADAAGLELPHGGEEPLHLVGREARGRLVEDEVVAIDPQRPGDGDERLLGAAEARHPRVGIEGAADERQGLARLVVHAAPVDAEATPAAGSGEAAGQADVLRHRHPLDEAEILVDEGHGRAGAAPDLMAVGDAVDEHLPAVRPEQAAQHLDEGRFAGAVLAQERHDLAAAHVERDALQRPRGAERLGDVVEAQDALGHLSPSSAPGGFCRSRSAPVIDSIGTRVNVGDARRRQRLAVMPPST